MKRKNINTKQEFINLWRALNLFWVDYELFVSIGKKKQWRFSESD